MSMLKTTVKIIDDPLGKQARLNAQLRAAASPATPNFGGDAEEELGELAPEPAGGTHVAVVGGPEDAVPILTQPVGCTVTIHPTIVTSEITPGVRIHQSAPAAVPEILVGASKEAPPAPKAKALPKAKKKAAKKAKAKPKLLPPAAPEE